MAAAPRAAAPARIPVGATLDPAVADAIAGDAGRATRARDHWRDALATLGADPFGTSDPDVFHVMRGIPHVVLDRSPDPEIARGHLLAAGDRAPGAGLIALSGCCVSGEELARFVGAGTDMGDLLGAVRGLDDAAKGMPARRSPGVAVRACRELHDAVRRIDTARLCAVAGRVTPAEALALHRQEGAFTVTPDARSYSHAPLTATSPGTCRVAEVTFSGDGVTETSRPGFNLVFRLGGVDEVTAASAPEGVRIEVMLVNAVVLGGLDILTSPRARPRDPGDELRALVSSALASGGPLDADPVVGLFAAMPLLGDLAAAVAMIELESRSQLPEDVTEFMEAVRRRLSGLVAAHDFTTVAHPSGGIDVMISGDAARDLREIQGLQCDWYGSRTDPETLRPWVGRSRVAGVRPGFSPFMTYLRFNMGDRSFMTTILRTATRLADIEKRWKRRDAARWPGDLPAVLRAAGGSPSLGSKAPLARALRNWVDLGRPDQHAWKAVGLIDRLRLGRAYPAWAPATAPAESAAQAKVARVVQRALDELAVQQLIPAIGAALEWTPVDAIAELGIPTDRRAFPRAHSFARLRLVYARAFAGAGVAADPRRTW